MLLFVHQAASGSRQRGHKCGKAGVGGDRQTEDSGGAKEEHAEARARSYRCPLLRGPCRGGGVRAL